VQTYDTIGALREHLAAKRGENATVGLVPTMGYLHEGHQQLIERAAAECDVVVTTIFVNPLQFAPHEDLDSYPRDPSGDARKAREAGSTVLFVPTPAEMYPRGSDAVATAVSVAGLGDHMEGVARPTHFSGVCTVVAKLFNIVGPCRAYFGEKDYQQLASIAAMVVDLSFPVEVIGCATSREPDGLARSSRNAYLTSDERAVAPVLHEALCRGAGLIAAGERDPGRIRAAMAEHIEQAVLGELDYVEVVDGRTLQPATSADVTSRLFGAMRFGRARLIDNIAVTEGDRAD
jgi:pantoate--beta-alanine ligase